MTRRACAHLVLAIATLVSIGVASARGQTLPSVRLTLASQTPWTTSADPIMRVEVVATNTGPTALKALTIEGSIGPPFVAREAYEDALVSGPTSVTGTHEEAIRGKLEPGDTKTYVMDIDMSAIEGVAQDDPKVYPLSVELRSAGIVVAHLFTNAIHLVTAPEQPMLFSWWFEITAEEAFGPGGELIDPAFEATFAPGGRLFELVSALRTVLLEAPASIDLVIQPSVLEQIRTFAETTEGGSADSAKTFLQQLREVAASPSVHVIALPLDAPSVPAMLQSGLTVDLRRQTDRGALAVQEILGVPAGTDVARPPGGLLDEATLAHYVADGATTVLADADAVERPAEPNGFAPPSTAVVEVGSDTADLVLPDPGTSALMQRVDLLAYPVRAAQAILGELAVVWKERPNPEPPEVRGIALAPPADLPPTIWSPLVTRLATAPFLQPVHAEALVAHVVPTGATATLIPRSLTTFSDEYAQRIIALQRDIDAYVSMLVDPGDTEDSLRRQVLHAESQSYLGSGEAAGAAWLEHPASLTAAAFDSTTPQVQQVFTFTGREGTIPLRMGDPGDVPLQIVIVMQSSQFDFPDGAEQDVLLERPNQLVAFDVTARASGQNPIAVTVRTPSGREISRQTIVVRTPAVNSTAVLITAGAGIGLLLLYARRRLRRTR